MNHFWLRGCGYRSAVSPEVMGSGFVPGALGFPMCSVPLAAYTEPTGCGRLHGA